ncbi:hypothetical protein BDR07DRAFT_1434502 [Suillus spraguei]|nr:hypothetical protein BDR07DRAFT_1434502 [Suillus spraguei]
MIDTNWSGSTAQALIDISLKHPNHSTEHLDLREIDACLFDVFGTVLDWHSTVTRSHLAEVWGESDCEELTIRCGTG